MAFARRLIDEYALGLAPGCAFGRNFNGYMRMCYAVSEPRLREALARLESALSGKI
jgi:aspartate/methionine/tyrosine aminotransferase